MTLIIASAAAAFAGAFVSACIGLGGGTLFIACLYLIFQPTQAIALHGAVQTVNNGFRLWAFRADALPAIILPFLIALAPAVALGWYLLGILPNTVLRGLLGAFILASLITPFLSRLAPNRAGWLGIGFFATLSSMLVGAADPALAPFFLSKRFRRTQIIATKAACQLLTHIPKVILFLALGVADQGRFDYGAYGPVLSAMVAAVILGVWLGKRTQINEAIFRGLFKGILFVMGLKLLVWDSLLVS